MIRAEKAKELANLANKLREGERKELCKKYPTELFFAVQYLISHIELIVRKYAEDGNYNVKIDCSKPLEGELGLLQKGVKEVMDKTVSILESYGYKVKHIDTDGMFLAKEPIILHISWA